MIDGTPHDWFQNGKKFSLHLAIDDATGEALCGGFIPTECLEGYVHMLEILATKYGLPENIYCDKHAILINQKDGELTQFGYMCKDLGINIIAANTPQAKGKVEKWNNTIQTRKNKNCKSADVKRIRIHDFRHSCASLLINKGASVALVSKYLGHSDVATTLNIYSHMFKSELQDIAEELKDL